MNEKHKWQRGETLTSIRDFSVIGFQALKECLIDAVAWADRKAADRWNTKEDES